MSCEFRFGGGCRGEGAGDVVRAGGEKELSASHGSVTMHNFV